MATWVGYGAVWSGPSTLWSPLGYVDSHCLSWGTIALSFLTLAFFFFFVAVTEEASILEVSLFFLDDFFVS